ncbi:trans-sialidase, putative, partial [Trypanosoma cruzi marinkellei]
RLVGFLSGNFSENEWRDEYLGVNAIVHGSAEKRRRVPNGLTFKGSGAWAEWRVGDMGQTVPYYFANSKFTLVATVSIHEVPKKGPIPLIGVRMNDTSSTVLFGLSYTHEKKWLAIGENPGDEDDFEWEPNTTYQVVLRMTDEEWTVFVDADDIECKKYNDTLFDSYRISHFYIGGDGKDKSATGGHVTVTNVLLYNDDLLNYNLNKLNASKVTIPSLGDEKNPTEQAVSTGVSVVPTSKREKDIASPAKPAEDDFGKQQGKNSLHDPVPEAPPSKVVAGSLDPVTATAAESAGTSLPEDNAHISQGETARQATLDQGNKLIQRDPEVQPKEPQLAGVKDVTDVEGLYESNDKELPEGGEADEMSGESTSSAAILPDMDTATGTGDD